MKLLFSPSSLLSAEDRGLLPRFMKCRDMARSSSWASTAEPCRDKDKAIRGGPAAPPQPVQLVPGSAEHPPPPPHLSRPPGARQPDQTHLEAESIPGVN